MNHDTPDQPQTPTPRQIAQRVERLIEVDRPRYRRLWAYCRNPMRPALDAAGDPSDRPYRQAQEWGLPARITGVRSSATELLGGEIAEEIARKEVVIENDIGWRVETMVDYLFGRPLVIESAAPDPDRRALIAELLRQILAHNGGIVLFQQLALLGAVHGFVDVLVKLQPCDIDAAACGTSDLGQPPASSASDQTNLDGTGPSAGVAVVEVNPGDASSGPRRGDGDASHLIDRATLAQLAWRIRIEVIEPARALPFVSETDYREVVAYGQVFDAPPVEEETRCETASGAGGWLQRLARLANRTTRATSHAERDVIVELITPTRWTRYRKGRVTDEGVNSLRRIPLVHVQNTAVPLEYSGGSDVEPLIPLQDELNTRLSDRASRITLQSFKMYLGKGIENFDSMPVAPGRMWTSDNEQADVIEFGGDASCPSEESHISDIREALDKTSGVTPIAAGAIKGRIGRLTSAAALRVTLQALLAKTEKKRTTYGQAIAQMCELSLAWLDRAGLFRTSSDERRVELSWPSPLPENEMEKLQEAEAKARLGVPAETLLRELGY